MKSENTGVANAEIDYRINELLEKKFQFLKHNPNSFSNISSLSLPILLLASAYSSFGDALEMSTFFFVALCILGVHIKIQLERKRIDERLELLRTMITTDNLTSNTTDTP